MVFIQGVGLFLGASLAELPKGGFETTYCVIVSQEYV